MSCVDPRARLQGSSVLGDKESGEVWAGTPTGSWPGCSPQTRRCPSGRTSAREPLGPGVALGCSPVTAKKPEKWGEGVLRGLWAPRQPPAPQQDSVSRQQWLSVSSKESGCPLRATALAGSPHGPWVGAGQTPSAPNRPMPGGQLGGFGGSAGRAGRRHWGGRTGSRWQGAPDGGG